MTDYHFKKFLELVEPNIDFNNDSQPPKPDYSDLSNWAARPENDAQQFYVPDESFQVNKKDNNVDVFYIHPTGFYEKKWNINLQQLDVNNINLNKDTILEVTNCKKINDNFQFYADPFFLYDGSIVTEALNHLTNSDLH